MWITRKVDVNLSPETIQKFCNEHDNWVLILDENLDSTYIRALYDCHVNSEYCCDLILSEIAEHINTPIDILYELSESLKERILIALATNPNITQQIIEKLLLSSNTTVKEHLEANRGSAL